MISTFGNGSYHGYELELRIRRKGRSYTPRRLASARDAYEFMADISNYGTEHLYQVLLDTRSYVHGVHLVGKGNCSSCPCDPADVFRAALMSNSPAFILVHNHPSGVPDPSPEDYRLNSRIAMGASILNIDFIDSIVVGASKYFSFAESVGPTRWHDRLQELSQVQVGPEADRR